MAMPKSLNEHHQLEKKIKRLRDELIQEKAAHLTTKEYKDAFADRIEELEEELTEARAEIIRMQIEMMDGG